MKLLNFPGTCSVATYFTSREGGIDARPIPADFATGALPGGAPFGSTHLRALRSISRRVLAALHQMWRDLTQDDRCAYLSRAVDLADLEWRMRAWDRDGRIRW